jgi:hypothetical protein
LDVVEFIHYFLCAASPDPQFGVTPTISVERAVFLVATRISRDPIVCKKF